MESLIPHHLWMEKGGLSPKDPASFIKGERLENITDNVRKRIQLMIKDAQTDRSENADFHLGKLLNLIICNYSLNLDTLRVLLEGKGSLAVTIQTGTGVPPEFYVQTGIKIASKEDIINGVLSCLTCMPSNGIDALRSFCDYTFPSNMYQGSSAPKVDDTLKKQEEDFSTTIKTYVIPPPPVRGFASTLAESKNICTQLDTYSREYAWVGLSTTKNQPWNLRVEIPKRNVLGQFQKFFDEHWNFEEYPIEIFFDHTKAKTTGYKYSEDEDCLCNLESFGNFEFKQGQLVEIEQRIDFLHEQKVRSYIANQP